MTETPNIEAVARQLAGQFLLARDWRAKLGRSVLMLDRLDCETFAGGIYSAKTVQAMAWRAAEILFEIAVADPLTVARLYFDLLPRRPEHPLTAAVIAALSDGPTVVKLLRAHGMALDVRKDESGSSFLTIHDMGVSHDLADPFKDAIRKAMDWSAMTGPQPQGGLHSIH